MKYVLVICTALLLFGCSDNGGDTVTPDTTPPTVTATFPASDQTDVALDIAVTATFSEPMNRWTFSAASFFLDPAVTGIISYSGNTVTFTPDADFEINTEYTATVTAAVEDAAGNPLDSNYVWSFTTTPGLIMPLAVGNRWEFMIQSFDTLSGTIDTAYDTVTILSELPAGSDIWYVDNDARSYANRADGLYAKSGTGQTYLFLKYPAAVGQTYTADPDISEQMEVNSVAVIVTLPNRFIECHHYISQSAQGRVEYFYAPNVGPARIDTYGGDTPRLVERRSLIRFDLQ